MQDVNLDNITEIGFSQLPNAPLSKPIITTKIYATIDSQGICTGISELSGAIDHTNLIAIDSYDAALMGKKFDGTGFVDHVITQDITTLKTISSDDFQRRFTIEQLARIFSAAKTKVLIEVFLHLLKINPAFDLEGENAQKGRAMLIAEGLLTAEEASEIFSINS